MGSQQDLVDCRGQQDLVAVLWILEVLRVILRRILEVLTGFWVLAGFSMSSARFRGRRFQRSQQGFSGRSLCMFLRSQQDFRFGGFSGILVVLILEVLGVSRIFEVLADSGILQDGMLAGYQFKMSQVSRQDFRGLSRSQQAFIVLSRIQQGVLVGSQQDLGLSRGS